MLLWAGYSSLDILHQRNFFALQVAPYLGRRPPKFPRFPLRWHSFMTDNGTPIEMSWSWKEKNSLPSVRYSIEPISRRAGTSSDRANLYASHYFVHHATISCPTADWKWYKLLSDVLVERQLPRRKHLEQESQVFFAFDLVGSDKVLKAYFIPEVKALKQCCSKFSLVLEVIARLSPDPLMSSAFDAFSKYIQSSSPGKSYPELEMVALDCVPPSKSRIKIYVRSYNTSFDDVIEALTLGGVYHTKEFSKAIPAVEQLWRAVLAVDPENPSSKSLPVIQHRTAGILYYYEFKPGSSTVGAKVYIPVRHYGINDRQIALGLSSFLKARGMHLREFDYVDALQELCKPRPLESGLGLQTYIACSVVQGKLNIASYLNPDILSKWKTVPVEDL